MNRTAAGVLALLLLLNLAPASTAFAETSQPPVPDGSNAVGACLDSEQVWLLVTNIDGEVLANQCVGNPSSGEEALTNAGMTLQFDDGMLCSISGNPDPCPTTFNGSYWNYHHSRAGEPYAFSEEGAGTRTPAAGDIEAWCYNDPSEESCEPPLLTILSGGQQVLVPGAEMGDYVDPAVTASESASPEESTPWALIATGGIIVAVGVAALVWWRSRNRTPNQPVGGR